MICHMICNCLRYMCIYRMCVFVCMSLHVDEYAFSCTYVRVCKQVNTRPCVHIYIYLSMPDILPARLGLTFKNWKRLQPAWPARRASRPPSTRWFSLRPSPLKTARCLPPALLGRGSSTVKARRNANIRARTPQTCLKTIYVLI